ncbi:MAG: hypothetical protein WC480_01785 [Patescibacteria group bacterium]
MCLKKFFHHDQPAHWKWGVLAALVESAYCLLVVGAVLPIVELIVTRLQLNSAGSTPPILFFFFYLLFFVFSVAISGIVVFGYPAYLAFEKKYKEALATVGISALTFVVVIVLVLVLLVVI